MQNTEKTPTLILLTLMSLINLFILFFLGLPLLVAGVMSGGVILLMTLIFLISSITSLVNSWYTFLVKKPFTSINKILLYMPIMLIVLSILFAKISIKNEQEKFREEMSVYDFQPNDLKCSYGKHVKEIVENDGTVTLSLVKSSNGSYNISPLGEMKNGFFEITSIWADEFIECVNEKGEKADDLYKFIII